MKALLPRYAGRIKCVYIDPPYNTGSQAWVYNDNVNSPIMQQWLKENKPVDGEDLERHDKWLCMMWPRLQLLRELLSDDGVIFVSIDDHEQHHLRQILDEIFGNDCFVASLAAVVNLKGSRDNRGFATAHEHVLVYEKLPKRAALHELPLRDDELDVWMQDDGGWYKIGASLKYSGENAPREKRPNLFYPIYIYENRTVGIRPMPNSIGELWPISEGNKEVTWRWGRERVESNPNEIIAVETKSGWTLHKKQRPPVGIIPTKKPKSTLYSPNYSATTATKIVKDIFNSERIFDYPKSPYFISDLITISGVGENDIVLDSFAGSGTTAHAVLALNKEDGGNRQFILVECEDYADRITAERVRRVIKGVPSAKDKALQEGLGGSFTYCELGEPIGIEGMLSGEALPSFESLARYLLYTASGVSAEGALQPMNEDGLFYQEEQTDYYLLYEPNVEYLRSNEAMLDMERAQRIEEQEQKAVVFGAGKYMGQRDLTEMGITFCQLPYELYRA